MLLQRQANSLTDENDVLQEELSTVQANLTLAQEYTRKSLDVDINDDTQILEELSRNEAEAAKEEAHAKHLNAIEEKKTLALLQLQNDDDPEPADIVRSLENKFNELSEQEQE